MSKFLSISNKLLSLRGEVRITDDTDRLAYVAHGELALLSPTWRLSKDGREFATIRQKLLAWSPTWLIHGDLGAFTIKRRIWSWGRRYTVTGGPFDGARIVGNLWDLKFEVSHRGQTLARATGDIVSLRDRHRIEVLQPDSAAELFSVIAMVAVQIERKGEGGDAGVGGD